MKNVSKVKSFSFMLLNNIMVNPWACSYSMSYGCTWEDEPPLAISLCNSYASFVVSNLPCTTLTQ